MTFHTLSSTVSNYILLLIHELNIQFYVNVYNLKLWTNYNFLYFKSTIFKNI